MPLKNYKTERIKKFEGPPSKILKKTLELIKYDARTLGRIAQETGLQDQWLRSIYSGQVTNPGVQYIEYLYEFLSGDKLEV